MKRKLSLVVVLALLVSMFAVTAMADTTATVDLANGTYTVSVDATVGDVTYDKASVMVVKPGKKTGVNATDSTTDWITYNLTVSDQSKLTGVFDYLDVIDGATNGKFTFTKEYSVDELYGTYGVYVGLYNAAGTATQSTLSFYGDILGAEVSTLKSLTSSVGSALFEGAETKYVLADAQFTSDKAGYRVFIATYNEDGDIESIGISGAPADEDEDGIYEIHAQLNNYSEASTSYKVFLWDTANKNKPVTKVIAGTI